MSVRKHGGNVGVGATSSALTGWEAPAALSAGLTDVLARLAPVGNAQPSARTAVANADTAGSAKAPARGFYERRKARKNVRAYSSKELAEIFGGQPSVAGPLSPGPADGLSVAAPVSLVRVDGGADGGAGGGEGGGEDGTTERPQDANIVVKVGGGKESKRGIKKAKKLKRKARKRKRGTGDDK